MSDPWEITLRYEYVSGSGDDGESYAWFDAPEHSASLSVSFDRWDQLGRPVSITLLVSAGERPAAGSYASV